MLSKCKIGNSAKVTGIAHFCSLMHFRRGAVAIGVMDASLVGIQNGIL